MDLLKTLLVYMSLVFTTSVQTAPEPAYIPTPSPTPYVVQATATPVPTPRPTPVPTINITPNPAYKTIQVGDNGDLVRQMQEKLAEYGYYTGEIDGRFGNGTRRAVEAFQYQHGLSADGIAGRRTLTVLYESTEIRPAPDAEATPVPTPEPQLSVAATPSPEPTPTPEPQPSFVPVTTAAPTAVPVVPMEMIEDGVILVGETKLEALPALCGDELYLPLVEILRGASMNVIASSSIEQDEFAFAAGEHLFRIAFTENQNGDPVNLEAYKDMQPQILPVRDVRRLGEVIYLPAASIESLTGIAAQMAEDGKTVTVTIPAFDE